MVHRRWSTVHVHIRLFDNHSGEDIKGNLMAGAFAENCPDKENSLKKELESNVQRFFDLYGDSKFDEIPDLYTDDFIHMPPGQPLFTGKEKLIELLRGMKPAFDRFVKVETAYFEQYNANTACISTISKGLDAQGQTVGVFKDVNIFKMVNGKWLVHVDIVNSN